MVTPIHYFRFWHQSNVPQAKTNVTFGRPAFLAILFGVHCNLTRYRSVLAGFGQVLPPGEPYVLCLPFLGLRSETGHCPIQWTGKVCVVAQVHAGLWCLPRAIVRQTARATAFSVSLTQKA